MDDDWAMQLVAKISKAKSILELVHGHGPAEVKWELDFREHPTKGRVVMPYKEDCGLCVARWLLRDEELREEMGRE